MPLLVIEGTDTKKLQELLLYIASKERDDPRFGAVKLNKILYYADFGAYRRLGKSISGDEYQHLQEGPAPRHLLPARRELVEEGALKIEYVPYFNTVQQRIVATRPPAPELFTVEELAIVDEVIEELLPLSGREASDKSHQEYGWRLTREGETIPYRTAWLSSEPLPDEAIQVGLEIAKRRGLLLESAAAG